MKLKFVLNEGSTIRGIIWLIGGTISMITTLTHSVEIGSAILGITASIAGGVGAMFTDTQNTISTNDSENSANT